MATANELEALVRNDDDYNFMVACANDEDEDGMRFLGKRLGVEISADDAWTLIDRYQTRGSAY